MPGFIVYYTNKYIIIRFNKYIALELGLKGIRTNVVAPGYINTPINASIVIEKESV
jgi:NAD(P)-dependent dehydrogenase (short-subunit alcohol dehydrogenase family)